MFWALALNPGKRCDEHFTTDLHVSAAVLDVDSLLKNTKKGIQIWAENHKGPYLIANLSRETTQFPLDIGFSKDERITFFTKGGSGTVYLHGYFVSDENDAESDALTQKSMNIKADPVEDDESDNDELEHPAHKVPKIEMESNVSTGRKQMKTEKSRAGKKPNQNTSKSENLREPVQPAMHDPYAYHGFAPYFGPPSGHWPTSSPFPAVIPEAYNYQQMVARNAFEMKNSNTGRFTKNLK